MKGPVVFDFDKTLTKKDTLTGFYREASARNMFYLKYPLLLTAAVLYKCGIISNDSLKKTGVQLYLKGFKKDEIEKIALNYSKKIQLNEIYQKDFLKYSPDRVIIISASFEEYLKPLFPEYKVIGSTLVYSKNKLTGLSTNMYGAKKKEWLLGQNINQVDVFYTDSYSDQPVIDLSHRVYMVEQGSKRELKT